MMTHRELCKLAARYLHKKGIKRYGKCQYVVCELERIGECPDAFGFGGSHSQLIEVWVDEDGNIIEIVSPQAQECSPFCEMQLAASLLRRNGITPIFFFTTRNIKQKIYEINNIHRCGLRTDNSWT